MASDDIYPQITPSLKVRLQSDWYGCSKATGKLEFSSVGDTSHIIGANEPIPLDDPSGFIGPQCLSAVEDQNGDWYIPAGWVCKVSRSQDAFDGHYELVIAGPGCAGASGSGSSGSGSGSGTGVCNTSPTPHANAPTITNPVRIWGQDANGCYGWVNTDTCPTGSSS